MKQFRGYFSASASHIPYKTRDDRMESTERQVRLAFMHEIKAVIE